MWGAFGNLHFSHLSRAILKSSHKLFLHWIPQILQPDLQGIWVLEVLCTFIAAMERGAWAVSPSYLKFKIKIVLSVVEKQTKTYHLPQFSLFLLLWCLQQPPHCIIERSSMRVSRLLLHWYLVAFTGGGEFKSQHMSFTQLTVSTVPFCIHSKASWGKKKSFTSNKPRTLNCACLNVCSSHCLDDDNSLENVIILSLLITGRRLGRI